MALEKGTNGPTVQNRVPPALGQYILPFLSLGLLVLGSILRIHSTYSVRFSRKPEIDNITLLKTDTQPTAQRNQVIHLKSHSKYKTEPECKAGLWNWQPPEDGTEQTLIYFLRWVQGEAPRMGPGAQTEAWATEGRAEDKAPGRERRRGQAPGLSWLSRLRQHWAVEKETIISTINKSTL